MFTIKSERLLVCLLPACALIICLAACGGGGDGGGEGEEVGITVSALDAETTTAFFAMGHDSTYLPYGGKGLISPFGGCGPGCPDFDPSIPRSASIAFQDVPEGESYRIDYVGYQDIWYLSGTIWYCYRERATKVERVISGVRNAYLMEPDPVTGRCTYLGGNRYVVNPNYVADPDDPSYGSIDGENVLTLMIHALDVPGDVTVQACDTTDPTCTAPFGIFTSLPDGVFERWWAHTGAGWAREMTVPTDGSGDALVYAVVKPGEIPRLWEIRVLYPAGNDPTEEVFRVRISNGNRVELRAE